MTRGNQRELARLKNLKKQDKGKNKQEGDPKKRKEEQAKALQEKIAKKKAAAEAELAK